jgi:hypothetical protein
MPRPFHPRAGRRPRVGGECQLEIFEGCEPEWVAKPGPMTDKAHEMVKSFIARYLGSLRRAA